MKPAIHYDADDIKAILAERHGVDQKMSSVISIVTLSYLKKK